jgi:hypothetical protein
MVKNFLQVSTSFVLVNIIQTQKINSRKQQLNTEDEKGIDSTGKKLTSEDVKQVRTLGTATWVQAINYQRKLYLSQRNILKNNLDDNYYNLCCLKELNIYIYIYIYIYI